MYSDSVIEHFMCPCNAWYMPNADGIGSVDNGDCRDKFMMFIRVREEIIEAISFLVFGCGAAVACGSMTTVLAKGKTINEAQDITEQDIIYRLGGLPEHKQHCSNLGVRALRAAIQDYISKHGLKKDPCNR